MLYYAAKGGVKMKIVNLTPHEIRVVDKNGKEKVYPPSGKVARVNVRDELVDEMDGVPVYAGAYEEIVDLPPEEEGTYYIVSLVVLNNSKRKDLITPDTTRAIRNEKGQIVSVKAWRKRW